MCISTAQARTTRVSRDWRPTISCKFPRKKVLAKCPCVFRLRRLAESVLPGLGIGLPPQHHHLPSPQHAHHHLPRLLIIIITIIMSSIIIIIIIVIIIALLTM